MTYNEIRKAVYDMLRNIDPKQYDAHIWSWLDYECCNANELRYRIADR